MREQDAPELSARQHGQRTRLESGQTDPGEQARDLGTHAPGQAETDGTALPCQGEKIGNGDRQRRIDGKDLRNVADRARPRPVQHDLTIKGYLIDHRGQKGGLARAVRADEHVNAAPADAQRDALEQRLAMPAHRERIDFEQRGRVAFGHASVISARIIVSTLRCISRSNLSGVYAPDAMCVMVYTLTRASSRSTFSIGSGKV